MPLGLAQEFNDEDLAALEALRDPNEQPLDGADDEPKEPAPKAEAAPAAVAEAKADEPKQPPAETPPVTTAGDPTRAQLRAARAGERRARDEADRLRKENEELRAKAPAAPADAGDDLTDEDIEALAADYPAVAKVARVVKRFAGNATPQQTSETQAQRQEQFVPPALPPELQVIVDGNDELADWQHNPDQTAFEMAKSVDGLLSRHPKWKDKPLAERFAEVVKRVNAEIGDATPTPASRTTPVDPQAALDSAPARTPRSIGDIGTGGGREQQTNDLARFQKMSEEDIYSELMTRG